MARRAKQPIVIDRELSGLSPEARWQEWKNRVEAVIFASAEPVSAKILARFVGEDCDIDQIIDELRAELAAKPFEVVSVAGGFQYRTRPAYASVVKASGAPVDLPANLSQNEALVLMLIGYFQPITRSELSRIFGREVSRDMIGSIRNAGFITSGPRSPAPGSPYTYVTTPAFLTAFGFETLRDLPDFEMLEDSGLLNRDQLQTDELSAVLGLSADEED